MNDKRIDNSIAQMRKGTLEFALLLALASKPQYAGDLIETLSKANLLVVEGTMYPLLSRLRREELISYHWQESRSGPPRKYYSLTENGTSALHEMLAGWKMLSHTIHSLLEPYEKNRLN